MVKFSHAKFMTSGVRGRSAIWQVCFAQPPSREGEVEVAELERVCWFYPEESKSPFGISEARANFTSGLEMKRGIQNLLCWIYESKTVFVPRGWLARPVRGSAALLVYAFGSIAFGAGCLAEESFRAWGWPDVGWPGSAFLEVELPSRKGKF